MKILRYLSASIAIILITAGIFVLTTWYRILTPDLYVTALAESGIYTQITEIVEDYATTATVALVQNTTSTVTTQATTALLERITQENQLQPRGELVVERLGDRAGDAVSQRIEPEVASIVAQATQSMQLEQNLQRITEESLTATANWFRTAAPAPAFFSYIPEPAQVDALDHFGLLKLGALIAVHNSSGLAKLPVCRTQQEVTDNLYKIQNGELKAITCTSQSIQTVVVKELENTVPFQLLDRLQLRMYEALEVYGITQVLNNMKELVRGLSMVKAEILATQEFVQSVKKLGVVLLMFSLPFVFLATAIAEPGKRVMSLLYVTLASGVTLILAAAFYLFTFPEYFLGAINLQRILTLQSLPPARAALLYESLNSAASAVATGVVDYTMMLGTIFVLVGISGLLGIKLHKKHTAKLNAKVEKNPTEKTQPQARY